MRHLAAPFAAHDRKRLWGAGRSVSERELEVLRLVALGHSNKELAAQLALRIKTIEVDKANAMRKLALRGRIELSRYAVLQGWRHDA